MSTKEKTKQEGELSEQQLDKVAGGQEVRKMETIVVTAKRLPQEQKVVKMETIVVTAQREKNDVAGTRLAQADSKTKKN
jgi:outer membrane cobalamin receptor